MRSRRIFFAIVGMLLISASAYSFSARPLRRSEFDPVAFIKEAMSIEVSDTQIQSAIWFPFEFSVQAAAARPDKTRAQVEKELAFLKPYIIIIAQCSSRQSNGSTIFAPEYQLRSRAVLKTKDSTEIKALSVIPDELKQPLEALKAMMALPGRGDAANMHVLVFKNEDAKHLPIVEASKRDKLTLLLKGSGSFGTVTFSWRTPFDAVAKPRPCARCGEKISAKWFYCPWCANKLN